MAAKRTAALEAHGGRVHAESQGPGLGARFVIALPATMGV
jgi:signal transduction histidine kinase